MNFREITFRERVGTLVFAMTPFFKIFFFLSIFFVCLNCLETCDFGVLLVHTYISMFVRHNCTKLNVIIVDGVSMQGLPRFTVP